MMWIGNGSWGSGGNWVMIALIVVVVVAVIVAIVFIVRSLHGTGGTAAPPAPTGGAESPQDILKRRYAAGEIDRDEYLQTRRPVAWRVRATGIS